MTEPATDAQLTELEEVYANSQRRTAALRRTQSLVSIALAATIVIALFMIYSRGKSMYTAEAFEPHVRNQFELLAPTIQTEAQRLVEDVAPVYRDAARARIETIGPELREAAESELFGLTERLKDSAEKQVADALARIEAKHVQRLQEHFPQLEDPIRREDMKLQFVADMETETVELLGGFHNRIMMDMQNIGTTIEGFRPNRFEDMERNALLRTYMHKWLMLADYEVMTADGRDDDGEDSDG